MFKLSTSTQIRCNKTDKNIPFLKIEKGFYKV